MRNTVSAIKFAIILLSGILPVTFTLAEGEAGLLVLRGQGHFFTGIEVSEPAENGAVKVMNQTYVGFQLPADKQHPFPIVLVHGGGGQSTDWFSTPDGRAGWRDYFLAAGYDVYWVDRPGYGRAPTNAKYGELRGSANSQIITFLANANHWPGNPKNPTDPSILTQLASTPTGPYAGNRAAAKGISELLDRIGPAILLTHSAGATAGWWAADLNPDKVAGIIAIEPGASNVTSRMREGLSFNPPLQEDFSPVKDADECELQPAGATSKLPHFPMVHLVGSELGLTGGLLCAVKAFTQAGVKVKYTYLPDLGFTGNGHFMMAEINNGDLAGVMMQLAEEIERERGKTR